MPISGILLSEKLSRGTDKPGSFSKFPARILALLCIGVPQRYWYVQHTWNLARTNFDVIFDEEEKVLSASSS